MTQDNRLSVLDIARELNTGKATIKFLLKRFKEYIPFEMVDGQPVYPADTLNILFKIQEEMDMGILPSQIEETLKNIDSDPSVSIESSLNETARDSDIRLSHDGIHMLKSLFNDIGKQQERIAQAHEKRAQVEEKKALAIEKRAQAEEKKAQAMNNIATALQEMNQLRVADAQTQQIAHQTGTVIVADESDDSEELDNLSRLISDPETPETPDDSDLDLSSLLDNEEDLLAEPSEEDPLSVDTDLEMDPEFDQELEDTLDDPLQDFDEDLLDEDLSSLEDDSITQDAELPSRELDDLSLLIDPPVGEEDEVDSDSSEDQLDDLSALIDDEAAKDHQPEPAGDMEMDDLSKLIDPADPIESSEPTDSSAGNETTQEEVPELDDLSLLIDTPANENSEENSGASEDQLDDLSALIDDDAAQNHQAGQPEPAGDMEMDDLSKLIESPDPVESSEPVDSSAENPPQRADTDKKDAAPISIDINPEDDLGKYKAAVTKIIIELKAEGLTVEQTTDRLNENNIKTLSGKSQWGQKAISQVYKFIDSAK